MLFSYEWLAIRKNGRFALCWLAATNPTAFRDHMKKAHLETMRVSKICDELINMLNTNTQDPRKRLSLYLAANLAYGTIKIYQKIVNNLLEEVTSSMIVQSFTVTNILRQLDSSLQERRNAKKPRAGPSQKPPKKRLKLMIENLEDFQQEDLLSLPQTMLSTANELITLPEVNLGGQKEPQESNLNDFGELTTQEATELLDFLESSVQDQRLVGKTQRNREESDDVSSFDIPLKEATFEEFTAAGPSRIIASTPIPHEVPFFHQDVVPIEVPENFPPAPEELSETPDLPIPPRKRRRKALQIDQIIQISQTFISANMNNYRDTMKYARPNIHQEGDPLTKACRKRRAEPFKELFKRNCKIRCQENTVEDILAEILLDPDPNNNMPEEQVMAPILEDFNQFGRKMRNRKRPADPMINAAMVEVAPPPVEEFQQIPPTDEIGPQVVPGHFQKIPQEHQDQMEDFTQEMTLAKLQKFWKRKEKPITMSILLQNVVDRTIAARAFMSLLLLGKIKQVKLHKAGGLEITHISPGSA